MTVYGLITRHEEAHPTSHFFDRETLKFFGERVSEMRILKDTEVVTDYSGEKHTCYVLSSLQRNHPCGARRAYHYFDTTTFDEISI